MPTKTYYLDDARTEPIMAKWGLFYRNFAVSYAGATLRATNPEAKIGTGRQYHLPDGRTFSAQLKENTWPQELELLLDGRPLPGSGTHPAERLKQAWHLLLVLGVANFALGLVAELGQVAGLLQFGLGWGSVVEGVAFLALGWVGYYRRSAPALTIALVLLILDGVLGIGAALAGGQGPALGGLFMRAFFCMIVFRGLQGAKRLRKEAEEAAFPAEPV
jgi:hypothetical protein